MSSEGFLGGDPFCLTAIFLLALSFELESSFSTGVSGESFSSLDFVELLLAGDPLGLFDLLSDSDSELLSGENILFFFEVFASVCGFVGAFPLGFGVFAPLDLGVVLPLARTVAADFGFAEQRLRGGFGFGLSTFGASSSLDEETLTLEGLLGLGSSFFLGSSGFAGEFGAGAVAAAGGSEFEESESELLDPDPELVVELPLLLESEVDPELLSELLLLTSRFVMLNYSNYS